MSFVSVYNNHRYARSVLKKFRKTDASFTVELHAEYWRFHGQDERLAYDGPMRPFLECVRSQTIPASILASLLDLGNDGFPIHDGCVIVEILDFRLPTDVTIGPEGSIGNKMSGNGSGGGDLSQVGNSFAAQGESSMQRSGVPYPNAPVGPPGSIRTTKIPQSQNAFTAVAVAMAQALQGKIGQSHSSRNPFKRGRESSLVGTRSGARARMGAGNTGGLSKSPSGSVSGLGPRPSTSYPITDARIALNDPAGGSNHLNVAGFDPSDPNFLDNIHPAASHPLILIEPKELPLESVLRYRTLMRPDASTLWEQMVHMNSKQRRGEEWDDLAVLHLEARILAATAPNLCLDPTTILPTRTANLSMNLTYPMPSYVSHDGSYIPLAERPMSKVIVATGPGLEAEVSRPIASSVDLGAVAVVANAGMKDDEGSDGQIMAARTTRLAKEHDQARQAWSSTLGLKKEDLDALAVGHDPAAPISKDHLFNLSLRVEKFWRDNSDWRRTDQRHVTALSTGPGQTVERLENAMQFAQAEIAGLALQHGTVATPTVHDGVESGNGVFAEMMERSSAQKPKRPKKKKKEQQLDEGTKQEDGDVDVSLEDTTEAPSGSAIAMENDVQEEQAKPKKKTKKDKLLERATKEEGTEAADSPPATGASFRMGKKRPADEMADSPVAMAAATMEAGAAGEKSKKLSKKQKELLAARQMAEAEEPVVLAEPPKKKVKKTKPKAGGPDHQGNSDNFGMNGGGDDMITSQAMQSDYGSQQGVQNSGPSTHAVDMSESSQATYQPHPDMQQAAFLAAAQYGLGNGMQFGHNGMGMPPMELPIQVQPNHGYSQPMQMPGQQQAPHLDPIMMQQLQHQMLQQQADGYRQLNMAGARHPGLSRAPGAG